MTLKKENSLSEIISSKMKLPQKSISWGKNKVIFLLLFFCFLITPLITATSVNATFEYITNGLNQVASDTGLKVTQTDVSIIIANTIKVVLLFLGIIAIIMIIIGGLMWMTSGGSEEKAKKARGILVNAIIGLFIVLVAYVITYWVINTLQTNVLI